MNMILHDYPTAELWRGNTLAAPHFKNKAGGLTTFDFAVANPPFSAKSWTNGLDPANDEFGRFEYGIPPAKNGDYAFLLHLIKSLKSTGKGAMILPHGVLFRGHKEADIRRNLVKRGLVKGIIGLPPNLFYGTSIRPASWSSTRSMPQVRKGIFMIDASQGFMKDGNKNRLRSQDIHKIVDVFNNQRELPGYSRLVPLSEIASEANDYNLNIPRYIDSSEPEDLHDLDAHLNGGIPERDVDALESYWSVLPELRKTLFGDNGRPGYLDPKVGTQEVKPTILQHPSFQNFSAAVSAVVDAWQKEHRQHLLALEPGIKPREVIHTLAEDLLTRFTDVPLMDRYAVYQRLMDYWAEVMQDDVYLIAAEGWQESAKPRGVIEDKKRKIKETPDLTIGSGRNGKKYKMDLIPPGLMVARFFEDEQSRVDNLLAEQETAYRELEEFLEGQDGEDDPLSEARNDKGNVTKTAVNDRRKAIRDEPESDEEQAALKHCLELIEAESKAGKAVKDAQVELNAAVLARYRTLIEDEIKALVVDDKWLSSIRQAIDDEVERVANELAARVSELEERYAESLPEIKQTAEQLAERVVEHLMKMGFREHV